MSFLPMGKACLPRWLPTIASTIRTQGGAQAGIKHPAAFAFIIILVTYADLRLTGIIVLLTDTETVRLILIICYRPRPDQYDEHNFGPWKSNSYISYHYRVCQNKDCFVEERGEHDRNSTFGEVGGPYYPQCSVCGYVFYD